MDACAVCLVARELAPRIVGARIEKVFAPLPGTWTFSLGRAGHLVLHTGKTQPFLCLLPHKPENPSHPSGRAMWLRKRLRDRRIFGLVSDWPRRRLALELSVGEGRFLLLDLAADPELMDVLPPGFGDEPVWPDLARIVGEEGLWREYPQLTPPLRRRLAALLPDEAESLLRDIRSSRIQTVYHGPDHRGRPQIWLWPVPGGEAHATALDAAQAAYAPVLARMARDHRGGATAVAAAAVRRIERALARLEDDAVRLLDMAGKREAALRIQAHLHSLDKTARLDRVHVPDADGGTVDVPLDPGLTVRENMERLFARAAKGQRGLGIVQARLLALGRELEEAKRGMVPAASLRAAVRPGTRTAKPSGKYGRIKVAAFRSSDGFLILRGRSAEANHQLLTRVASPFDFWLHAKDGPGAHVIVRRDFAAQEVPEGTILEAAALAALASHLKMAHRGDVLVCLVRDVRTVKGAPLGLVDVDRVLRTVRPALDPALEERLRLAAEG